MGGPGKDIVRSGKVVAEEKVDAFTRVQEVPCIQLAHDPDTTVSPCGFRHIANSFDSLLLRSKGECEKAWRATQQGRVIRAAIERRCLNRFAPLPPRGTIATQTLLPDEKSVVR